MAWHQSGVRFAFSPLCFTTRKELLHLFPNAGSLEPKSVFSQRKWMNKKNKLSCRKTAQSVYFSSELSEIDSTVVNSTIHLLISCSCHRQRMAPQVTRTQPTSTAIRGGATSGG
jgi:hypothetical protein